jgi:hypothetical protein
MSEIFALVITIIVGVAAVITAGELDEANTHTIRSVACALGAGLKGAASVAVIAGLLYTSLAY